jgi:hypothetical protein
MTLTEAEAEQIIAQRSEKELKQKKFRFNRAMLQLSVEWFDWYKEEGLSLTMSVFLDDFNAEDRIPDEFCDEISTCFNALKRIVDFVNEDVNRPDFRFSK